MKKHSVIKLSVIVVIILTIASSWVLNLVELISNLGGDTTSLSIFKGVSVLAFPIMFFPSVMSWFLWGYFR